MADQEFLARVVGDSGVINSVQEPLNAYQALQYLGIQTGLIGPADVVQIISQDVGTGIPEEWPALPGDTGGGGGGSSMAQGFGKVGMNGAALSVGNGADWQTISWARGSATLAGAWEGSTVGSGNGNGIIHPGAGFLATTGLLWLGMSTKLAGDLWVEFTRFDNGASQIENRQQIAVTPVEDGSDYFAVIPLNFVNTGDYYEIKVKGYGATAADLNAQLEFWG